VTNDQVLACIDPSPYATAVCDYASWAAARLGAPLTLLHAIHHRHAEGNARDLSGAIGLGSQESLLDELAEHDRQAAKLAMERGRVLLDGARQRVAGRTAALSASQVHGPLVDRLVELEPTIRLVVMGRRGENAEVANDHLSSNVERVVRALHRPILVVPQAFTEPRSFMLAFDNGPSTRKALEVLMRGPLFRGMQAHLVSVAPPGSPLEAAHGWARGQLETAGFTVTGGVLPGDPETVLTAYQHDQNVDLAIMGAYGHSRIRRLLVGSTTTALLRQLDGPLLLLR
jgi:nucleotide-binding universal stress UspA family protein